MVDWHTSIIAAVVAAHAATGGPEPAAPAPAWAPRAAVRQSSALQPPDTDTSGALEERSSGALEEPCFRSALQAWLPRVPGLPELAATQVANRETAPPAGPTHDFSLQTPLGLLDAPDLLLEDVQVAGFYRVARGVWRSHGGRLYRFNHATTLPDGTRWTRYRGLGFCSPADLSRTCLGQVDETGQPEMLRIRRPDRARMAKVWLSEVVGNDWVRLGVSDGPDPVAIRWIAVVKAGEGDFSSGKPCGEALVLIETPRPCDAIEGPIHVPPEHQGRAYYWLQGVPPREGGPPGMHGFVLWGVTLQ